MEKIKVGINGFGRIGRAVFRNNIEKDFFDIVAINDINPFIENLAYALNYDSTYGSLNESYHAEGNFINNKYGHSVRMFRNKVIDEVDWVSAGVDIVIDTSGIMNNVNKSHNLVKNKTVKKCLITHSPKHVDFTMVLGANELDFNVEKHNIISSSICDATAIAPVLKIINQVCGIDYGFITTIHPWLNYQNLLDGNRSSFAYPAEKYYNFELGRSSVGNLIPKKTSAIHASCKVLSSENLTEKMIGSMSYRIPTAIVGSADITIQLKKSISEKDLVEVFEEYEKNQKWLIIRNNIEPLVSIDFKKSDYSAIIDHRWTKIINNKMLKIVLWYDNEWGYSSRVLDQIKLVQNKL